jgi:hypothetical protein
VVSWLVPIPLFWMLAALYLGGADINIEGGSGKREATGLLLNFASFLVVWAGARAIFAGMTGAILAVVLAALLAAMLLPLLAKLTFRVVGVRITSAEGSS